MADNSAKSHRLCAFEDIPEGASRGFALGEYNVFAVKQKGKLYLYHNSCPHLGIPLEWVENQFLDSSASMIQCANHGALFVINSGKCVTGPCAGQSLKALSYRLEAGVVILDLP